MSKEIMQQALNSFEAIMFEKDIELCQLIAKNARYSLREVLAQPEQAPKLTDAGADTNIVRGLEPKGSGMVVLNQPIAKHVCNLWINPKTFFYEVDRCTHPINEVIPVYTAPPKRQWVGLTEDEIKKIMQRWRNGYIDIKDVEQLLKELNT